MLTSKYSKLSRREFLKLSGFGVMGSILPRTFTSPTKLSVSDPDFGRVVNEMVEVFDQPSFSGNMVRQYWKDSILPIDGTVIGDSEPAYNQTWRKIGEIGYIHSTLLQPVGIRFNPAETELPVKGVLADVSIPFTDAYTEPSKTADIAYRYYYGSTHWVDQVSIDEDDQVWYRVRDDRKKNQFYYVNAVHLHVIPDDYLAPISSDLKWNDKRIEVFLGQQMMIAYEKDSPVLIAQVSTADSETNSEWYTPLGRFQIYYKRPSQHMATLKTSWGEYDLPGVPWICYFTREGHGFHGTYWHNEFGKPRSHGCINLPPDQAKWLYQWTTPVVPPGYETVFNSKYGTQLDIFK